MTPKKSSYVKVFSLFLLMIAGVTAVIIFVNRCLRLNDMASPISLVILFALMVIFYYLAWRWLSRKLKQIESR